jgi:hypothetical protein
VEYSQFNFFIMSEQTQPKIVWLKNPNGILHKQEESKAKEYVSEGAVIITDDEAQKIQDEQLGVIDVDAQDPNLLLGSAQKTTKAKKVEPKTTEDEESSTESAKTETK